MNYDDYLQNNPLNPDNWDKEPQEESFDSLEEAFESGDKEEFYRLLNEIRKDVGLLREMEKQKEDKTFYYKKLNSIYQKL